ncbi:fibrous sheath CABYR-binding protein-like [Drosophila suzukii]|uniref:Fibrous sheath CABYR-binding protein-like n=1 Tax=Drosophila suzukii TaxID=28584 RepID=A0ABM4TZJ8_DROSZ
MSIRVTRAEARRRMAALQEPRPGQGWMETRPTGAPRRALERSRDEDSAPEPAEREWRLRKAAAGGRIPRGTTEVGGGAELPRSHSEEVCRATEETRKRFRDREPSDVEQQRSTEEEARWQTRRRQDHEAAAARWHARLREAEEEERRLWEAPVEDSWEVPLTPRYAAEEPSPRSEDGDEPCAPSPPRWLPEVPPTPRYEGEWLTDDARDGGAPFATPPWRPARPPTPRYMEPQRPEEQTPSEVSTAQPMPQPQKEEVHQARAEEPSVVRTEVPAAHVSTRAFVAEGVRADEGGAQDMGGGGTQGEPSGLPDEKPTGCVGSADTKHGPANTGDDGAESLEKGPWVWPEPPATQRPPLQRQASTPGSTRPRPQFMRQVSAPEEGGWREVARSEWPEGIEEALAVATARRKGGRRCVLVCEGGRRYRVRLGVAGIGVFTQ